MIPKKKKANAPLIAFAFIFTLMTLMIVGVDFAHIMASRYQLQHQTEIIALDYASRFGTLEDGTSAVTGAEDDELLQNEIRENYTRLSRNLSSYNIDHINLESQNNGANAIVRVNTTASISPFFIGFIGIRRIIIHANSYAITNNQNYEINIPEGQNSVIINLDPPLIAKFNSHPSGEGERKPLADFSIRLEYPNLGGGQLHGGFFVFAGYNGGNERWTDIGNFALNNEIVEEVAIDGTTMNCINSDNGDVFFEIPRNNPRIARINSLRIYKSSAEVALAEGQTPCALRNNNGVMANVNGNVQILNGVSLTNKRAWSEFNTSP